MHLRVLPVFSWLNDGSLLFTTEYYVGCVFVRSGFYYPEMCSHYTHVGESSWLCIDVEFYQMLFVLYLTIPRAQQHF